MTRFPMKMLASAAAALTLVTLTAVTAAPEPAADAAGKAPTSQTSQTSQMDPKGQHGRHGDHANRGRMGMMQGGAMAEQRLAKLKTELKISAAQEPAWSAFAAKATEQATAMKARHLQRREARKAMDTKPSAPDRMTQRVGQMKLNLASMEVMSSATRDLYAALTPEQRAVADQQFSRQGRHGKGHGPRS